jgi:predicted nucleic acid-binding protein
MAANVVVDASFLVTLLNRRDSHHEWAREQALSSPPPWMTCEAALSEAFHLLGSRHSANLAGLIGRLALISSFRFDENAEAVLRLQRKYSAVPMSFADACLVRMTEILADPLLLTTHLDFRIYRRHSRLTIPCILPT